MKKNVALISFFNSENLGDIELSKGLFKIIERKYNIELMYDFSTLKRVEIISNYNKNSNSQFILKRVLKKIVGNKIYSRMIYNFKLKRKAMNEMFDQLKSVDKLIIGGGNMLMDKNQTWPLRLSKIINFAHKNDISVSIVYVGAGPITHNKTKKIYREIFKKVQKIIVRDKLSKKLITPLAENITIDVDYDPALYFDNEQYLSRLNRLPNKKTVIGINILGRECFKTSKENSNYLSDMYSLIRKIHSSEIGKVILFSTAKNDYVNINRLNKVLDNGTVQIAHITTYEDIRKLYSELDFLVGSRMHSLIFAQTHYIPYMAISWDSKVDSYVEMINLEIFTVNVYELSKSNELIINTILNNMNKDIIKVMKNKNKEIQTSHDISRV